MRLNSTIRNVRFAQGVEISLPIDVLEASGEIDIPNDTLELDTGIKISSLRSGGAEISLIANRFTEEEGDKIENIVYRIVLVPSAPLENRWVLVTPYKSDEGDSTGLTFSLSIDPTGEEATLLVSSSNLSGTGHRCILYYRTALFNKI